MSKKKKVAKTTPQKNTVNQYDKKLDFVLGRENYILMAIGFVIIIIGFILLSGGGSNDPNVFDPDIFSFRRITLAPIVLLFGFLFEIYAIMKKPKNRQHLDNE